jgi:hypothetical protein
MLKVKSSALLPLYKQKMDFHCSISARLQSGRQGVYSWQRQYHQNGYETEPVSYPVSFVSGFEVPNNGANHLTCSIITVLKLCKYHRNAF